MTTYDLLSASLGVMPVAAIVTWLGLWRVACEPARR
jgi:hypothetical protein